MDCELCGIRKAAVFAETDWGTRHVCEACRPEQDKDFEDQKGGEPDQNES